MPAELQQLAAVIQQQRTELAGRWVAELERRSWVLRAACREPADSGEGGRSNARRPGPLTPRLLTQRCEHFLEALSAALSVAPRLEVGAPEFREPLQVLSFAAGWMAGVGFGVGDALALVQALEAVLGPELTHFYQALLVVVAEAFLAAVAQQATVRYRDAVQRCQLVLSLGEGLPALFLVGDPDRQAVDHAVGRLLMLATMRGARTVCVDLSGISLAEAPLGEVLQILFDYLADGRWALLLCGLPEPLRRTLEPPAGLNLTLCDGLEQALALCSAR